MSAKRTAVAAALVFVAGLVVAHTATDGFAAYTLESARRFNALRAPASVANLALNLADGGRVRLAEMPGQVLLVDFIYTNCTTYCVALGSVYAQLKQRLAPEIAAGTVRLVSVTFDPLRDGPDELHAYRTRHSTEASGWEIGQPAAGELQSWLSPFGVVVIPDQLGGYAHNAAVHVVGPDRKLVAIHDLEDVVGVEQTTRRILGQPVRNDAAR